LPLPTFTGAHLVTDTRCSWRPDSDYRSACGLLVRIAFAALRSGHYTTST
jgi:hypothetical protein